MINPCLQPGIPVGCVQQPWQPVHGHSWLEMIVGVEHVREKRLAAGESD